MVERLAVIAREQSQAAYAAFTRAVQNKWLYLQRVVPNCDFLFLTLENKITYDLLPSIFGCETSSNERSIFSLPTRLGGLKIIINPTESCEFSYTLSRRATDVIVCSLKTHTKYDPDTHYDTLSTVQSEMHAHKDLALEDKFKTNIQKLSSLQRRAVQRATDSKLSSWLNMFFLLLKTTLICLPVHEFRDALALCYKKPLLRIFWKLRWLRVTLRSIPRPVLPQGWSGDSET